MGRGGGDPIVVGVEVRNLSRRFGDSLAVDGVDLSIREGELLVLLGPSGCGKTTLLRMIAGLEHPNAGEIYIGGRRVDQSRSEEHTSELQSQSNLVCRLLLEKKNTLQTTPKLIAYGLLYAAAAGRLHLTVLLARSSVRPADSFLSALHLHDPVERSSCVLR